MKKFFRKNSKFLAAFLVLILSTSLLTGCFAVDLIDGVISGIHKIFDKNAEEDKHLDKEDDVYIPEGRKEKPAKPEKNSSAENSSANKSAEECGPEESDSSKDPSTNVTDLAYVNQNYLLDSQQLYVSLDDVDFIGPAFDLCTAIEEYNYYMCDDSYWGYGDHGCIWEIDTFIYVPDGSGRTIEESINVYLYLDSPAIPNSDGALTMYTDDTIELLAEKFEVDPSEIKTMESGGTTWHYANDGNEFFAGAESFFGVYAYLEYDCFVDEMETDPRVLESLKWQFEAFLSRLQLAQAQVHRSEMGAPALLITADRGSLYGPRFLWDDDVIDRDQEFDLDWWDCEEDSLVGGFTGEIERELYLDEDKQYLSLMSDDEIGAILAEEMFLSVLQQDTDNECIVSDIRWIEGNGVRWTICSSVYPTTFNSKSQFNDWTEYAYGITDGGEVISVEWNIWLDDPLGLTDEMYQEICSVKLAEFENWLSLVEYH